MELVKKAEKTMEGWFKSAPKISDSGKESLAKAWPWIALVFGVLQLWAAWVLWDLLRLANRVDNLLGSYLTNYAYSGKDKLFIYLGLAVLVADAVILLMAYPHLKKRVARGWHLLFLGALLNVAYAVVNLFISTRGFGSFLLSLLGSAIGFWLLFQVKDKFHA